MSCSYRRPLDRTTELIWTTSRAELARVRDRINDKGCILLELCIPYDPPTHRNRWNAERNARLVDTRPAVFHDNDLIAAAKQAKIITTEEEFAHINLDEDCDYLFDFIDP